MTPGSTKFPSRLWIFKKCCGHQKNTTEVCCGFAKFTNRFFFWLLEAEVFSTSNVFKNVDWQQDEVCLFDQIR